MREALRLPLPSSWQHQIKILAERNPADPVADISTFELPGGAGQLRLIAGSWQNQNGPAETAQLLHLWDLTLNPGYNLNLPLPHK